MIARVATVRSMRGRGMATVPVAIGRLPAVPKENLTATRSFRAARARISAIVRIATGNLAATVAMPNRGRSEMLLAGSRRAPLASRPRRRAEFRPSKIRQAALRQAARCARPGIGDQRPRFSRPREDRPEGDRPFRERPKFDRPREDRPKFDRPRRDRNSDPGRPRRPHRLAGASPQRARAAAISIVRAGTMRTTARSLPNARRSAAAAPIASATRTSAGRRVRQRSRNPASASPRWCRGQGLPRAAMPKNGSCRGASRSTAV